MPQLHPAILNFNSPRNPESVGALVVVAVVVAAVVSAQVGGGDHVESCRPYGGHLRVNN